MNYAIYYLPVPYYLCIKKQIMVTETTLPKETKKMPKLPNLKFQKEAFGAKDEFEQMSYKRSPFTTKLSFVPLIRFWKSKLKSENSAEALLAREIIGAVEKAPELLEPLDDYSQLQQYPEVVELLMAGLFPLNLRDVQLAQASRPFDLNPFFQTPALKEILSSNKVHYRIEKSAQFVYTASVVRICCLILNKYYGQHIELDPQVLFTIECPESNIQRYFKSVLNINFVEVKKRKPLRDLTPEQINQLLSNIYDLNAWLELIPPSHFELHGLAGMDMIDVSEVENLSRLRYKLLEKDAVMLPENIQALENLLRNYFLLPKLRMGLTAIDYPRGKSMPHRYKVRFDFLAGRQECLLTAANANSIYEKVCKYKEILLVEDLEAVKIKTPVERDLLKAGLRSIMVAPLLNKEKKIIGILEIGSPNPFELHSFTELHFKEIVPLFSIALERSREEIDNRIEAIIREQFTTLHPSVEWKFIECAFNFLETEERTGKKPLPPSIVFEDVHPLYAQADIVSSSVKRNTAIQLDFIENLKKIRHLLQLAKQKIDFPLLDYYLLKTKQVIEELQKEIKSNDESRLLDFIKNEIHPLLEEVAAKDPELNFQWRKYFDQLDSDYGVIYHKRKDYEASVTRLNDTISEYLEAEEVRTQKMIPHYFEKYKTDGVEFELYAGQSLLKEQKFGNIHLKNLRLWQLIALCDITRKVADLKDALPVPLSTAQLVFVYNNPISIRFRMDDKQFDVDGAYNIRYEIIKKRIDKALIDGTTERLT